MRGSDNLRAFASKNWGIPMIGKLTLAALAVTLIAAPVMAQTAPPVPPAGAVKPGSVPPINPSAYAAIDNIRNQYMAARDNYLRAQQAEIAARANLDRATTSLLNVLSASVQKPATPPMPNVVVQPLPGQPAPGQPVPQPPRP
jgi:hypothetical protein